MRVFTGGKKYDSLSHNMVSLTGKICVLYCWGGESTRGGTNRGPRAWLACLRDRGGMIRLLQLLTIMIGPIARGVHHTRLSLSLWQPCTMQFSLCTPHAMGNNLHHLQTRHVCVALARCMHTGALGLAGLLGTWVDRGVGARDRVHGVRREQTNDYETRRNLQSKLDFAFALIQHAHIHAQPP